MIPNITRTTDLLVPSRRFGWALVVFACWLFVPRTADAAQPAPPNVLFIAVDDLRPEIFSFGREQMETPNLDRLAERGVRFEQAYCMVPTCGASRASLMTGIRPARNRFVTPVSYAEKEATGVTTLNTHFKSHGYRTVSLGKVFHHTDDNEEGWSEQPWLPTARSYAKRENSKVNPPYEWADVADNFYRDGRLADKAIAELGHLADGREPFFLAVGFFKPHLPFVAPTRYWQRYPTRMIQLPDNYFVPQDAPNAAIHKFLELRTYGRVPQQGPLEEKMAKFLIRGYYACVSYVDAQIGRVLDELDRKGLTDNTIIVLCGDHGWNLGEHTLWSKNSCFETAMKTPLIVSAPMLAGSQRGAKSMALTEFIDIYPSLCDLARLPKPEHLEGKSFVPLLKNPTARHKDFAIGRFHNGDTIRTDRYRYTLYTKANGKVLGRMLYDHQVDPDENVNIAGRPELAATVQRLEEQLLSEMGSPR